ncbi:hypothetical protein [Sphingopyxis sp. NJF-3]
MIELPADPAPNGVQPTLLDFGMNLRPSTGAAVLRVDRKGSRYRLQVSFPPMLPSVSRIFVARLLKAKREGLRIAFPLIDVPQGAPGSPVVDGAGQTGTSLAIRGLTPGYAAKEGYWLSIEDENGQHFLHNVSEAARADGSGEVTLNITPELRAPFLDGATVHLAKPMVEGFVDGNEWSWTIPVNKLVAIEFTLEEAA